MTVTPRPRVPPRALFSVTAVTDMTITPRPCAPLRALFCNRHNRHGRYAAALYLRLLGCSGLLSVSSDPAILLYRCGLVARSNPRLSVI